MTNFRNYFNELDDLQLQRLALSCARIYTLKRLHGRLMGEIFWRIEKNNNFNIL